MHVLTFVVAIAVGTLLIFLFSRWNGRVGFTLANAFWGSAIGHIVPSLLMLALGFLLQRASGGRLGHWLFVAFAFQTVLFQIIARTQNEVLRQWRAALIALIIIVASDIRGQAAKS